MGAGKSAFSRLLQSEIFLFLQIGFVIRIIGDFSLPRRFPPLASEQHGATAVGG